VEQWREDTRDDCFAGAGVIEDVESIEEIALGEVTARLYRPRGGERDVLIWIHGGGWIVVDLDCCDGLMRAMANRAGCAILSVGYRRAPESPFPAAIEDCWAATTWASERFDRFALGGDSAGGNLAAVMALRARDIGIDVSLQLLVYPVLDWRVDSTSYNRFVRRYDESFFEIDGFGTASRTAVRYLWDSYVPQLSHRGDVEASPLRASSLAGLAPALIITAEHDIFREEDEDYARRLADDGVPIELHDYKGQLHGFYHLLGEMSDARDALERSASALRVAFAR